MVGDSNIHTSGQRVIEKTGSFAQTGLRRR